MRDLIDQSNNDRYKLRVLKGKNLFKDGASYTAPSYGLASAYGGVGRASALDFRFGARNIWHVVVSSE